MSYVQLFKRYAVLKAKLLVEYRLSFLMGLTSSIAWLIMSFLFWGVVYGYTTDINGWTFGQIMMLQGFFHLAVSIYWFLFHYSEHMDDIIVHGDLDKLLSKPVNPLIAYMFERMDLFAAMDMISALGYFWVASNLGVSVPLLYFAGSLAMILLGCVILTLMFTVMGSLSFWIGRTESMINVWNSIWEVGGYPATIFSPRVQLALTFGLPIIFMQTYPTMMALGQMTLASFAQIIAIELALIGVWFVIAVIVWRKGLKRYGSYGG
ncbi:ABC-2 family transporter protein [Candidatus Micrarchaeota archaeon]|nr:ABC-2 family transporter protein [Candidatus Micrarchaeota archaeon]